MKGRKDDAGKPRWDLLPFGPLEAVVRVLTWGAKKYGDNNWQDVEDPEARYFAAAMRHLSAWKQGEQGDPETGESPLAHAVCGLLFIMGSWETKGCPPSREDLEEGPTWVCNNCGEEFGKHPAGEGATWHHGHCDVCDSDLVPVTQARDFGYLR